MSQSEPAKVSQSEQEAKTALQSAENFNVAFYRAPFFRTVQADGSWGRISPSNLIHLSLYNDCEPLPAAAHHKIGTDGKLIGKMELTLPAGVNIAREVEVDIVLSLEAAKAVRNNLDNLIKILEGIKNPAQT